MSEQPNSSAGNHAPMGGATTVPPLSLSDRVRSLRLPERSAAPAAPFGRLPWVLCALFAVAAAFFGLRSLDQSKQLQQLEDVRKGVENTPAERRGDTAAPAKNGKDEIILEAKGYIIPISLVQVSPVVGGRVKELYIEEGNVVKENTILAVLEKDEFQADFDRAQGTLKAAEHRHHELTRYRSKEIEQAEAELDETKAQRDQLYEDYKRNLDLKNRQAVAARDFDQAQSSYLAMDRRLKRLQLIYELIKGPGPRDERIASAKGEWDQAKGDFDKAKWRLDNCTIKAPLNGIILSKKAEKGNYVNPSAFSNGLSASLCEMADLTKMEVDLAIAERDVSKVSRYQECQVRAEAFSNRIYKGYISRIMPAADRAKGAVPVRVVILGISRAEEGQYLRPEMGAIVTFLNRKVADAEIVKN